MAQIEYRITTPKHLTQPIVLVEFTRDDLEKLVYLYPEGDGFTAEVRNAMRYLDGLAADSKAAEIECQHEFGALGAVSESYCIHCGADSKEKRA